MMTISSLVLSLLLDVLPLVLSLVLSLLLDVLSLVLSLLLNEKDRDESDGC